MDAQITVLMAHLTEQEKKMTCTTDPHVEALTKHARISTTRPGIQPQWANLAGASGYTACRRSSLTSPPPLSPSPTCLFPATLSTRPSLLRDGQGCGRAARPIARDRAATEPNGRTARAAAEPYGRAARKEPRRDPLLAGRRAEWAGGRRVYVSRSRMLSLLPPLVGS